MAAVSDIPSWITESSTEHSAWPGAVPLVSGPLPASTTATGAAATSATTTGAAAGSTTTGPIAGARDVARQTPAGSAADEPGVFVAEVPAADVTAADGSPSGPGQSDLPTRRPGNTGLAWGENGLRGRPLGRLPAQPGTTGRRTARRWPCQPAPDGPSGHPTTRRIAGARRLAPAGGQPDAASDAATPGRPATRLPRRPRDRQRGGQCRAPRPNRSARPKPRRTSSKGCLSAYGRQIWLLSSRRRRRPCSLAADEPTAPSPEAARNTMAAVQLGWQRGRSGCRTSPNPPDLPNLPIPLAPPNPQATPSRRRRVPHHPKPEAGRRPGRRRRSLNEFKRQP